MILGGPYIIKNDMVIFIKLRSQTSKSVQDVRKLALETCICVSSWCLACLDVLRVIVLGEADVEGL